MLAFIEHNVPTCFTSPFSFVSFFSAHDNDVKEANKSKSSPSASQSLQPQAHVPLSHATPSLQRQPSSQQLLLQARSYPQLSQHPPALSQLHMLADCQALGPVGSREYLQPHQAGLLSASIPASSFTSFPSLASGLRGLPLQGPISMQVSMGPERHCLGLTYGSGYLSSHHTFTAGCFDRWRQEREDKLNLGLPPSSALSAAPEVLRLGHRRRLSKQKTNSRADPTEVIVLTWELSFFSVWVFMNWGCLFFKIIKPSEDLLPVPQTYDLGILF